MHLFLEETLSLVVDYGRRTSLQRDADCTARARQAAEGINIHSFRSWIVQRRPDFPAVEDGAMEFIHHRGLYFCH